MSFFLLKTLKVTLFLKIIILMQSDTKQHYIVTYINKTLFTFTFMHLSDAGTLNYTIH